MTAQQTLQQVVADLYQTPLESVSADFGLNRGTFRTSAGRGVLAAAIRRRLGTYSATAFTASTFGELESAILNLPAPVAVTPRLDAGPTQATPAANGSSGGGVALGLDVEMVASMPESVDFWTTEFYPAHFTAAEIAYCVQQAEPRMHFAARWCAKEALAKCDPLFHDIDPTTVQVTLTQDGQPVLERLSANGAERLPHAVSLTHTALLAAAVVACPR